MYIPGCKTYYYLYRVSPFKNPASLLSILFKCSSIFLFLSVPFPPFAITAAVRNLNLMAGRKSVPDKGPVMLLYELFNDVKFDCVPSDGSQHSRFKMIATANGKTFEGTGPSKKLAKNAAAKAALAALCNISYSPMNTIPGLINGGGNSLLQAGFGDKMCNELPQMIADGIGK